MLVRANSLAGCLLCDLSLGGAGTGRIAATDGAGGANAHGDVLTIQKQLSGVRSEDGGRRRPGRGRLDRPCGQGRDRRMSEAAETDDPGRPLRPQRNDTAAAERAFRSVSAKSVLYQDDAARLKRVGATLAYLIATSFLAERAIEAAMDYLNLAAAATTETSTRRLTGAPISSASLARKRRIRLSRLRFIRTTTAAPHRSDQPSQFGSAIFEAIRGELTRVYGLFADATGRSERSDGATSRRIYLCEGIDAGPADHFAHILTHELFHFVDDETKKRRIIDAPHGYTRRRDAAFTSTENAQRRELRAVFTHTAIGRYRAHRQPADARALCAGRHAVGVQATGRELPAGQRTAALNDLRARKARSAWSRRQARNTPMI